MADHNILIVAGEPSGDIRAGELLKELIPLLPKTHFWGIGGDTLSSFGVELIEHVKNLSIVGIWEALIHLPKIKKQYNLCIKKIEANRECFPIRPN